MKIKAHSRWMVLGAGVVWLGTAFAAEAQVEGSSEAEVAVVESKIAYPSSLELLFSEESGYQARCRFVGNDALNYIDILGNQYAPPEGFYPSFESYAGTERCCKEWTYRYDYESGYRALESKGIPRSMLCALEYLREVDPVLFYSIVHEKNILAAAGVNAGSVVAGGLGTADLVKNASKGMAPSTLGKWSMNAVTPDFRTTSLSGICVLGVIRKDA